MNVGALMLIILIAVSYYMFSNEFLKFTAEVKRENVSCSIRFLCFLVVYVWFVAASVLELPLIINWLVFLIILGLEVHFVFSVDFLFAYALSMFYVILGLAINIFFRSFVSIALEVPLNVFDNAISTLKAFPIFLGFVVMAGLLFVLRRVRFTLRLEQMLNNRKSLVFYACTEVFIYLFLSIQLLVFTEAGDSLGMKAWGIKSALFTVIILVVTIIYALRLASLHFYMDRQHELRIQLIEEKKDINKLWTLAYTDMLTGCSNRQLLDRRLNEYAGYGGSITMAFIDVNGLKIINDQYGHMEGDQYLVSISRLLSEVIEGMNVDLFRYGGDEFVMTSNTLDKSELTALLDHVNERLKADTSVDYARSVSFGVVHGECKDYEQLIAVADEKMYQHKLYYYENTVRSAVSTR